MINHKNNRGLSIIEVLIAAGILSIISFAVASLIISQNKEVSALTERLMLRDIEAQLISVMNVPGFCGCLMRGLTLNTTTAPMTLSSNPSQIPLGYVQPVPAPPTACAAIAGTRVPASGNLLPNSRVRVNQIFYSDIVALGSDKYSANLNVSFDPLSGIKPHAPIKASVLFAVNGSDPANAKNFTSCGLSLAVPRCRVCFRVWGWGNTAQCGWQGESCSAWSDTPNYTNPFSDDTDHRGGGCVYSWKLECI